MPLVVHFINKNSNSKVDPAYYQYAALCDRDVQVGDVVTVGECRPLSKTVRFNVLKVSKGTGKSSKKSFQKF